jgi:hypothetical protein
MKCTFDAVFPDILAPIAAGCETRTRKERVWASPARKGPFQRVAPSTTETPAGTVISTARSTNATAADTVRATP